MLLVILLVLPRTLSVFLVTLFVLPRFNITCSSYYICCVCVYLSKKPEHVAIVKSFNKEFKRYPRILENTQAQPEKMTNDEAVAAGTRVAQARRKLQENPFQTGLKTRLKEAEFEEPFKDVSVFFKYFPHWDMVNRIACDPAHQFYNLIKDFLALIGDYNNMSLKQAYLDAEQDKGRLLDVNVGEAPWQVSNKFKTILTLYQSTLKIPNTWPLMLDYFSDEFQKIKIGEALAYCGSIGCYFTDLTDIPSDEVKQIFVDMLQVCGKLIDKCSPSPAALKEAHDQLVSTCCCIKVVVFTLDVLRSAPFMLHAQHTYLYYCCSTPALYTCYTYIRILVVLYVYCMHTCVAG